MAYPKAYEPQQDCMYQILSRYKNEPYEHCDYAKDRLEKNYLITEYHIAYGNEYTFKAILLPKKYHPKSK